MSEDRRGCALALVLALVALAGVIVGLSGMLR